VNELVKPTLPASAPFYFSSKVDVTDITLARKVLKTTASLITGEVSTPLLFSSESSIGSVTDCIVASQIALLRHRFCCFWSGCKVYDKPTRNLSCLEQHIRVHTGVKRFQVIVCAADNATEGAA